MYRHVARTDGHAHNYDVRCSTFLAKRPVDENPAGCERARRGTSRQQRRPRGLSLTCRAQKPKSPVSRRGGERGTRKRLASGVALETPSPRKKARRTEETDRGDKREQEERRDGRTDGRTDGQTDMREGMKIITPRVALGHKCQRGRKARRREEARAEFVIRKSHTSPVANPLSPLIPFFPLGGVRAVYGCVTAGRRAVTRGLFQEGVGKSRGDPDSLRDAVALPFPRPSLSPSVRQPSLLT